MKNEAQIKSTQNKIDCIDKRLITDSQNKQLKTDKAILSELITFLKQKK